jgi:Ca-activated chloride channel family protein
MRLPALLLLAVICCGALAVSAQEPFTVKVDVSLVTLDVVVSDSAGRQVTTLNRDDFEVYEDGALQHIQSFASIDSPYHVLMLFDCSGSTRPSWPFLLEAMNRFTVRLRPQDSIAVAQFGGGFKMLLGWTSRSTGNTDVGIQTNDSSCNDTDFYGAINRALTELKGTEGRKGAVVLTDGVHTSTPFQRSRPDDNAFGRKVDAEDDSSFQKVLRSVRSANVAFYFVAIDTDLNPRAGSGFDPRNIYNMQQVRSRMEQLAEVSGGRMAFPKTPQDVIPLYEQIGRDLGTSYGLGYAPPNPRKDGTYRAIEVRVRDKSLHVRQSRIGYEAR